MDREVTAVSKATLKSTDAGRFCRQKVKNNVTDSLQKNKDLII